MCEINCLPTTMRSLATRQTWQYQFAAHAVRRGGVIAHPTEAVWGLACNPLDALAVRELLTLKARPESKGLILVSGQAAHFDFLLAPLSEALQQRFFESQPHPVTWLLPDTAGKVPCWIKGEHKAVAVRLSDNPVIVALSKVLGHPIVSSSANPAGLPPAKSLFKVRQYFADSLAYILPAPLGEFSRPSIIRDLETGYIVRA